MGGEGDLHTDAVLGRERREEGAAHIAVDVGHPLIASGRNKRAST